MQSMPQLTMQAVLVQPGHGAEAGAGAQVGGALTGSNAQRVPQTVGQAWLRHLAQQQAQPSVHAAVPGRHCHQ